jgi:hypothetical protein
VARSAALVLEPGIGAWILRIDIADERMPKPRHRHQHIDVDSPEAAATYLRHLNELVGPVESTLEHYEGLWTCRECHQWRLAP